MARHSSYTATRRSAEGLRHGWWGGHVSIGIPQAFRSSTEPALSPHHIGALRCSRCVSPWAANDLIAPTFQRFYPTVCCQLLRPFSLGYFSLTPGILPYALRAGFAVRTRSCACVGQQKKSDSSAGRRSKRPLRPTGTSFGRKRQPGDNAQLSRLGKHSPLIPSCAQKKHRPSSPREVQRHIEIRP